MTVSQLIVAAFSHARGCHPELNKTWINISAKMGSQLPNSHLIGSVNKAGELDIVLRCMEDDHSPLQNSSKETDPFSFHYQMMLSEFWVGAVYEIFRLLDERQLAPNCAAFTALAYDLRLLRIPIEKHQIAADRKLSGSLRMQRYPLNDNSESIYEYSKTDLQRAHSMLTGISERGSAMWQVIDIQETNSYWLERLALSERFVTIWE